jgi:hypothetical protein
VPHLRCPMGQDCFCSPIAAWIPRASPIVSGEAWSEHLISSRYALAAPAANGICGRHSCRQDLPSPRLHCVVRSMLCVTVVPSRR